MSKIKITSTKKKMKISKKHQETATQQESHLGQIMRYSTSVRHTSFIPRTISFLNFQNHTARIKPIRIIASKEMKISSLSGYLKRSLILSITNRLAFKQRIFLLDLLHKQKIQKKEVQGKKTKDLSFFPLTIWLLQFWEG